MEQTLYKQALAINWVRIVRRKLTLRETFHHWSWSRMNFHHRLLNNLYLLTKILPKKRKTFPNKLFKLWVFLKDLIVMLTIHYSIIYSTWTTYQIKRRPSFTRSKKLKDISIKWWLKNAMTWSSKKWKRYQRKEETFPLVKIFYLSRRRHLNLMI